MSRPRTTSAALLAAAITLTLASPSRANDFDPMAFVGVNLTVGDHAIAPMNEGAYLGAIVLDPSGAFYHVRYDGVNAPIVQALPGANAVNGKGVAAVYAGNIIHVFEVEASGLYYMRSPDHGNTWDGWYYLDQRAGLIAPAAISTGQELIVFTQSTDLILTPWATVDLTGAGWHQTPSLGSNHTVPAAVSWGPGRADVFGMDSNQQIRHWWTNNNFNWVGTEELGFVGGAPRLLSTGVNNLSASVYESGNAYPISYNGAWNSGPALPMNPLNGNGYSATTLLVQGQSYWWYHCENVYHLCQGQTNSGLTVETYPIPGTVVINLLNGVTWQNHRYLLAADSTGLLRWSVR